MKAKFLIEPQNRERYYSIVQIRLILLPILLSIWLNSNQLFAEQGFHAFQVRSSNSNIKKSIKENYSGKLKLQFQLRIARIGRLKITLKKQEVPKSTILYTDKNNQITQTKSSIINFKGLVKHKNFTSPLAGSAFAFSNKPEEQNLILSFSTKRKANTQLNKIKTNLSNPKHYSRLYRLSKSEPIPCGNTKERLNPLSNNFTNANPRLSSFSTFKEIELNLDADAYWYQIFGSDSHNFISMFVNEAEVIYEEQLGLTFKIIRQNVFIDKNFGSVPSTEQLNNYLSYSLNQTYSNYADIFYLLSGKDNYMDDTIGIAKFKTLCFAPSSSFGMSQFTNILSSFSVITHEIGHILGAIHDDGINYEGNLCSSSENFIMSPFLNNTSPQSTFSLCSINSINSYLTDADFCLTPVSSNSTDATPNTLPPRTPMENPIPIAPLGEIDLKVRLNKNGTVRITTTWQAEEDINDCRLYLDADYNPSNLATDNSKSFTSLPLENSPFSIKVKVPFKIKAKNKKFSLLTRLVCNQAERNRSQIVAIKPNKIDSQQEIKPNQWLRKFTQKLRSL